MDQGFVDLRGVAGREGSDNESFWPSFTDIMTVIVMIFLIAMVVLLVRNMHLVDQLRSTMEAERMAAKLARETSEQKESLALKLVDAENKLSVLRMELMKKDEQNQRQAQTLEKQRRTIGEIQREKRMLLLETTQLTQTRDSLSKELQQTSADLEAARQALVEARQDVDVKARQLNAMTRRLDSIRAALDARERELAEREAELSGAREALSQSDATISQLRGDYGKLKRKYEKLVRPARSPLGRYVVEVRYRKVDGRERIELRPSAGGRFQPVDRNELERRLTQLKKTHPRGLYIKVIIPKDSGLSYNEALKFTTGLHRAYDYYFQDDGGQRQP